MMKKMYMFMLVALAALFANNAMAVPAAVTTFTGSHTVDLVADQCSVLSQKVNLNVSANVQAAFGCDNTNNVTYAGACHENGGTGSTSVACSCTAVVTTAGTTYTSNLATCSCSTTGTPSPQNVEVTGRKAYGGNSNGGIIGVYQLGTGAACTSTTLSGISLFQ